MAQMRIRIEETVGGWLAEIEDGGIGRPLVTLIEQEFETLHARIAALRAEWHGALDRDQALEPSVAITEAYASNHPVSLAFAEGAAEQQAARGKPDPVGQAVANAPPYPCPDPGQEPIERVPEITKPADDDLLNGPYRPELGPGR